jgi:hypothetical protein
MERVLPFLILLVVGNIMRRTRIFPENSAQSLNLYVIYIALPALILIRVPQLSPAGNLVIPVLMPWLVLLVSGSAVWFIGRLLGWQKEITGAMLLMVPLGNTAFLGIPMVELFYGSTGVPYAVLYDQFGSFPALATYGTLVIAFYGGGPRPTWIRIAGRILFFPPFMALLAALAIEPEMLPVWLEGMLEMTAGSLVPVVMVAIGFQLHFSMPSSERLPLFIGLVLRLVVVPLVFLLAVMAAGLGDQATRVSLFETAMPPMVAAGAMASAAGLKPRLTAAMVGFGILLSFITLPAMHALTARVLGG